ncbi:MAG: hypothetical protein HUU21_32345 [Polyangiaceae bacterium]|nr:hypothetical protein [Polyangiaceae bacterium]
MNQVFCTGNARRDRHTTARPVAAGLALLFLMTGAAACGGDPTLGEDEPTAEVSQAGGPPGYNGVTPAILAANHLSTIETDLATVTVAGSDPVKLCSSVQYNINTGKYDCALKSEWGKWLFFYGGPAKVITQDRYQLLKTLIDCALPDDHVVLVPNFPSEDGMFGLYKDWVSQSIPHPYRQLLSSCAAAKVNAFGATVPIGFTGPGPTGFLPDPIPDPSFMYQEATFFGDLFGPAPLLMACSGKKDGGGSYVVGKNLRVCGQIGNPCHIRALGACDGIPISFCDAWAGGPPTPGMGPSEHCVSTNNGVGAHWKYPLTVYLQAEPELIVGDVARCGLKGDQPCEDDGAPNGT